MSKRKASNIQSNISKVEPKDINTLENLSKKKLFSTSMIHTLDTNNTFPNVAVRKSITAKKKNLNKIL